MKKFFGATIFFLITSTSFALSTKIPGCPHKFTTTLQTSDTHEDVKILQQILNSDSRTVVAYSGPGSSGQETNFFGKATRDALKRFQALFIEYIGVADGKFNDRTRTVIQSICGTDKVENYTASSTTSINKLPLLVRLTANTENISGSQIKILIEFNKEVKKVDVGAFIVNGASVSDVRKLSKTQFSVIVSPQSNARNITLQIEADRVIDIDGVKNAEASNEIILTNNNIPAEDQGIIQNTINNIGDTLSSLLSQFSSARPSTKYCNGIQVLESANCTPSTGANTGTGVPSVPVGTGQVPINTGGGGTGGGTGAGGLPTGGAGAQNQSQQMLNNLLKSLSGSQSGQNNPGSTAGSGMPPPDGRDGELGVATKQNNIECGGGSYPSDKEARDALAGAKVNIGNVSTLQGLPKKMVVLLGDLKRACNCEVVVTGGTSQSSHKTHGPNLPVVDVRTIGGGAPLLAYINSTFPKTAKSYPCMDYARNVWGAVFNYESRGCGASADHWHVEAYGYACKK